MATIDDKVVAMSFESSKFESGVNNTLSALDKLKAALHFPSAGKGLDEFNKASKRVDLSHIASGVQDIESKLGTLRLTAVAVFASIAQKALQTGSQLVKTFTIDPMKAGFKEYSTNLNAVQTILANTQASGATLKDVNAALDELNTYSDKTIYNFGQMARNIGTFTAAGVDLKTATASIKGIANLAALSGSNADQASTAMYQLSQAISSGSVKLMDWNSVVNAGMGGTVFQRALAQTAEHMGRLKKGTVELVGPMKNVKIAGESFRNSLSAPGKDGWLSSGVLTETLKMFTSDMTDAELRAKGWNEAQIKAIQAQAKTAMLAATNVKTLSQVLDVAKETAGSGWAKTWQLIFGDFGEAKKTFTQLSNAINGILIDSARARNNILGDWKALGGRTVMIDGIKNAFKALGEILAPIKAAFREFFPATTGKQLFNLTKAFDELAKKMHPSVETVKELKRTFEGVFAVLDIGWEIIKGVVGVFTDLIGATSAGGGGFLAFTAKIGTALKAFHEWLIEGGRLAKFFDGLSHILQAPLQLISALGKALSDLFSGFSPGAFSSQIGGVTKAMTPFQKVMEAVGTAWGKFIDGVSNSGSVLRPALEAISQFFQGIGPAISGAFSGINFDAILQVIRTGLFAGLVVMFKQFLGKGSLLGQISKGFSGGIISNISGSFKALQGSMVAMQNNVKADTLQKIAIAIGILTASIVALSFIDPERLKSSLTALGFAFGELLGAMAIMDKIGKSGGFLKMPFIAGSMILLAGAIDTLSIAVVVLSRLSWGELLKGLGGVAFLLLALTKSVGPLSANSAGMVRAGIGITAISFGLLIMSTAVKQFASMNMAELGKGLGSVAVGLGIMVAAMKKMPAAGMVAAGAGITAIAIGLKILASAVQDFGQMDLRTIGQGLGGIAIGLAALVIAMNKMPTKSLLKNAAGLVLMAGALKIIASAVETMGAMSLSELAKGLGALGGAMLILGLGMKFMSGSMAGAAALAVVAASLALLAPVLITLGKQSWGTIVKGLGSLALAIGILAGASLLLVEAVPAMLGLGAALLLIGGGLALAGAGVFLIGAGLSAIAVAGPTAVGILIAALIELENGIIKSAKNLILGLLEIVQALADTAPQFVDALIKILNSLLDAIIKSAPKIAEAFNSLLALALKVINANTPKIIQAGFNLIIALLQGIKNNIPRLVTQVVDIIATFLRTIANNIGKIVTAGLSILTAVIKGIIGGYTTIITTAVTILTKFVTAIANNIGKIAAAGLSILTRLLKAIADNLGKVISAGTDVVVAFVRGIGTAGVRIVTAAREAAGKFIKNLASQIVALADDVAKALITLINGMATVIDQNAPALRGAGMHLGWAIINGMTGGLTSKAQDLYNSITHIMGKAKGLMHLPWKSKSPSQVMVDLGENIMLGMSLGLEATAPKVYASATAVSNGVIGSFNDTFQTASPSKVMYQIGQYVGQGFAQGLHGSADNIKAAFADLKQKLHDDIVSTREDIASEQDKLNEMLDAKQEKLKEINGKKWKNEAEKAKAIAEVQQYYAKSIKESEDAIRSNEATLSSLVVVQKTLTKDLQDEKTHLIALRNELDKVNQQLKDAQDNLAAIIQQRDDFAKQQREAYDKGPEISKPLTEEIKSARESIAKEQGKLDTLLADGTSDIQSIADARKSLADAQGSFDELVKGKVLTGDGSSVDVVRTYLQDLNLQQKAVASYGKTLAQLRELKLDEKTYRMLVEDGVADKGFAEALLRGGATAVDGLNKLDGQIDTSAQALGDNSAAYLYREGIRTAQGIIDGLVDGMKDTKGQKKLTDEVNNLAKLIIATMRKKLKSKSPSQEFAEIGMDSMEGLAMGFSNGTKMVTESVDQAAKDALSTMRQSMRNISDGVMDELNSQPVITPILDLTQVRSQAGELTSLTTPIPITAAASYGQASLISAGQSSMQEDQVIAGPGGTSVKFEQNNYSPAALTEIEIYRQTKNQLSQLKSALAIT